MLAVLLGLFAAAGFVVMLGGIALAVYANSPRNRRGNELADIGVAMGVAVAVAAGLVMIGCVVALLVRSRRR